MVRIILEQLPTHSSLRAALAKQRQCAPAAISALSVNDFAVAMHAVIRSGALSESAAAAAVFAIVGQPSVLRPLSSAHMLQATVQLIDVFRLEGHRQWLAAVAAQTADRLRSEPAACPLTWVCEMCYFLGQGHHDRTWAAAMGAAVTTRLADAVERASAYRGGYR